MLNFAKRSMAVMLLILGLGGASSSWSVALLEKKATDDSVCDLAPFSSHHLARRAGVFVPADANTEVTISLYERLGLQFIAKNCQNNQMLVLEAWSKQVSDMTAFQNIANTVCVAADVSKKETVIQDGIAFPGVEFRCRITKAEFLPDTLSKLEAAEPLDSLRQRLRPAQPSRSASPSSTTPSKDCGSTIGMGSILGLGGSGCK